MSATAIGPDDGYLDYEIVLANGSSVWAERPKKLPEAGDILAFVQNYTAPGGLEWNVGDEVHLMERTEDAPYGKRSALGNWRCITKHGVSVWSNIEWLMAEGQLRTSNGPA